MEGWPEGWSNLRVSSSSERFASVDERYILYGEHEGCRRAAWAIEGGPTIDREKLARALHDAGALGSWSDASFQQAYRAMADEAIRLIGFEAGVDRLEARTKIEGLERANALLKATADEALARAQQAEEARAVLRDYDSPFEQDAEDLRAEVQRLQSVVARTAQAAARLADALGEMAGGGDA